MTEDTFISHLVELRDRLLRALLAIGFVTVALTIWPGIAGVYDLLAWPMIQSLPEGTRMIATGVVSPGLYAHERRIALPLLIGSIVLFLLGVAYCYFVVFRLIFQAIQNFAPQAITPAPDIEAYLNFVITMFLAFGITFEIPLIQVVLVRGGVATVEKLKGVRSFVIVGAFVVAAIVTPPDVLSQLLLAIPMCLLYEVGIFAARLCGRSGQRGDDGEKLPEAGGERG